ncbi:MAG: hypothetical protein V1816_01260 [Pseudomonadota bacterium]
MPSKALKLPTEAAVGGGPVFELRVKGLEGGQISLEVWQMPSLSTPRLVGPEKMATLEGRTLEIVETRVLRSLKKAGVSVKAHLRGVMTAHTLDEEVALTLSLLFKTLAPMRNIDRIRKVAEGIDAMTREEAGYWLGMALHRRKPRLVLASLRLLLLSF